MKPDIVAPGTITSARVDYSSASDCGTVTYAVRRKALAGLALGLPVWVAPAHSVLRNSCLAGLADAALVGPMGERPSRAPTMSGGRFPVG